MARWLQGYLLYSQIQHPSEMKKLKFEEIDEVGESTLEIISKADNFNKWMYDTISPHCNGKVLEIGSGIGNISSLFLKDGYEIMLTDLRSGYCDKLKARFENQPSFLGAIEMDLTDAHFSEKFEDQSNCYDTVFALNVLEHIHDDEAAIGNCCKMLKDDGHLIILAPSYQNLYNKFDKELGHYRRYNKSTLSPLFLKNGLKICHTKYFNLMGIFGWYVSGQIIKNESIPKEQMKFYNSLVPISRIVDKMIFNSFGLSTIVVGKKQHSIEK